MTMTNPLNVHSVLQDALVLLSARLNFKFWLWVGVLVPTQQHPAAFSGNDWVCCAPFQQQSAQLK